MNTPDGTKVVVSGHKTPPSVWVNWVLGAGFLLLGVVMAFSGDWTYAGLALIITMLQIRAGFDELDLRNSKVAVNVLTDLLHAKVDATIRNRDGSQFSLPLNQDEPDAGS